MAPENVPVGDYHSRLHALYETLDIILHPMPKRPLKKLCEDKFVLDPGFAPQIDAIENDNKQILRFQGCIYFEKLNKNEQKTVNEVLNQYALGNDNFLILPPRFCKTEKKCKGHHTLENIAVNAVPGNMAYCYIYFFA